jgi:uncharacterized protein (DUF1330 family)
VYEPKGYAIAQVAIHDRDGYQQYANANHLEIFGKFSGRILAIDDATDVIEGGRPFHLTVLVEFPTKELARAWYDSDDYQAIVGLRHSNATSTIATFGGLPDILLQG